jgi:cobyrinic acid a,c-diamide synthase
MPRTPALVVAAPSTGSGKTTVVCALTAALRARPPGAPGRDVRLFKAGPDYLDPTWHTKVSGRPSRNLDAWMTGPEGVIASFRRGSRGGDLALVEGVMGLFDGWSPTELTGSGAELAVLLDAPVLLVVDAGGMARTAAAVVHGLATFDPQVRVAGVIFNRVGGEGHTRILREAMAAALPHVAVLGGLPARPDLAVPERHLGLVAADLVADPDWIGRLAAWAAEFVDLDAVVALAGGGVALAGGGVEEGGGVEDEVAAPVASVRRVRIGVARDAAFHFYYADNLDLLEEAGAELVPFSPLTDARLPNVDGLYLGGGYPEEHAAALTTNASMRASIRAFAEAGGAIYAECGGLMYLGDAFEDAAGAHPMCGVLPLTTRMTPALRSFGYRDVVATADTLFGPAGTRWKGHEFHYSELASNALAPVFQTKGWGGEGVEGWAKGRVLGTYVHAHFGSNVGMVEGFLRGCAAPLHADARRRS